MIDICYFVQLVNRHIRPIMNNRNQLRAIIAKPHKSQFLVAGPGSGKTTVLVLKALKYILVDGISPNTIMITTFTRKAAKEIRSRILEWSDSLRDLIIQNQPVNQDIQSNIQDLNFNDIITGTLDSISQDILTTNRKPGVGAPVIIQEFVAKIIIKRIVKNHIRNINEYKHSRGISVPDEFRDEDLLEYVRYLQQKQTTNQVRNKDIYRVIKNIWDRIHHDQVDFEAYVRHNLPRFMGILTVFSVIYKYNRYLRINFLLDYTRLEVEFLENLDNALENPKLLNFLNDLKIILVDEYQDTNLLQERIYFRLAHFARGNNILKNRGNISVVGDDDQSLYRFRGATVGLFTNFIQRYSDEFHRRINPIFLAQNYRSTENIINFFNDFIDIDPNYAPARVDGKPRIVHRRSSINNFPIIGIFRQNRIELAEAVDQFLQTLFTGGININHSGHNFTISLAPGVNYNDFALLCDKVKEFTSGRTRNPRLPNLLRNYLEAPNRTPAPINVFNPRGFEIQDNLNVQILLGLILNCIDPQSRLQNYDDNPIFLGRNSDILENWRRSAQDYLTTHPPPNIPLSLYQYVAFWQTRNLYNRRHWDARININSLIYTLINWIPDFYNSSEGLVYLQAITEAITEFSTISRFKSEIYIFPRISSPRQQNLTQYSFNEFLFNIFVPIAEGVLEINEDLYETIPEDHFNIMTIHQAKGLEFPVVFLDMGSDFKIDSHLQRFRRFPFENQYVGGEGLVIESDLRDFSVLLAGRPMTDRAFDDLIRKFFVSYSRPMDLLVLLGLTTTINGRQGNGNYVPNIASGWIRMNTNPGRSIRNWNWGIFFRNLNLRLNDIIIFW